MFKSFPMIKVDIDFLSLFWEGTFFLSDNMLWIVRKESPDPHTDPFALVALLCLSQVKGLIIYLVGGRVKSCGAI